MPMPELGNMPTDQIVLHFETNNVIEMVQLSAVFSEFAKLAHEHPSIGRGATVVLRRVNSGSPTTAWVEILNAGGAVAGIGQFGLGVATLLQNNQQRKLSRRVAELMLDNDVIEFSIATKDPDGMGNRQMTMKRDQIPAVAALEAERVNSYRTSNDRELNGRIVTTHGGRFAVFRTGEKEYQISGPEDLIQQVPIGEDIIVDFEKSGDNINILKWRLASDDLIDWENDEAFPGVQVEKSKSVESRAEWPDKVGQTGRNTSSPDISFDEERMIELLSLTADDFISFENTVTLIGRFERGSRYPIFRTKGGRIFRVFSSVKRKFDEELVVRAQIIHDDINELDWLNIMDVFPIEE